MKSICLVDLGENDRSGYVIGACLPATSPAYSPSLDIAFYRQSWGWNDEISHFHTESEEFLIVLKGRIDLLIDQSIVSVPAGQLLGMRAGVPHKILHVDAPVECLSIRIPGGGKDIVFSSRLANQPPDVDADRQIIQLDLCTVMHNYPLGALLPRAHPNYTNSLDLTCVWGADPMQEWSSEPSHSHSFREEYYFLLRGQMDFEIDGQQLRLRANQILGVHPPQYHHITGGQGPVDVLIVRVPGGRDDKRVEETE